jgi:hypothetical protein
MRPARVVSTALLLALALAAPAGAGGCPSDLEYELAALVNLERMWVGLAPAELDVRLVEAAQRHADDVAANGLTGHTGSDGSSPGERMQDAGYGYGLGEAVGGGQPTVREVVDAWMASTAHRSILLHARTRHIGAGHATGPSSSSPAWVATVGDDPGAAWSPDEHCAGPDPGLLPEPEPPPAPISACNDGIDNDRDGSIDLGDSGCRDAAWYTESPECADGIDNDGDGRIDADGGSGQRPDRQCREPWTDSEGRTRKPR